MFISDNLQGFPGPTLKKEWGVAFVTFNPWGYYPSQNTQTQCQGDAGSPDAVERGQPCSKQYISSQNMFSQELATWDCIELGHGHDQPLHAGCGSI